MKRFLVISALLLTLFLCSCGEKSYDANEFLPEETSSLYFAMYDGEKVYGKAFYSFENKEELQALLNELRGTESKRIENADYEIDRDRLFGIEFTAGSSVSAIWTGNYLVTESAVYKFKGSISAIAEKYLSDAESTDFSIYFPGLIHLAKKDGNWVKEILTKAKAHLEAEPPTGVEMTLKNVSAEGATVRITNKGEGHFEYGSRFYLQAELDGEWYDLPILPGVVWTDILYIINPDGEKTEDVLFFIYGDLPQGKYRLVIEDLMAEFIIE